MVAKTDEARIAPTAKAGSDKLPARLRGVEQLIAALQPFEKDERETVLRCVFIFFDMRWPDNY